MASKDDGRSGNGGAGNSASLDAALAKAAGLSPHARTLLAISAYLAPRRISFDLIAPRVLGEIELQSAADALVAAGIAQSEPLDGAPGLLVLPVVSEQMRARLGRSAEASDAIEQAVRLLADAYPQGDDAGDAQNWPLCERLGEHARAALTFAPDEGAGAAATSDLLHQVSHYLFARGRFEEAEPLLRRGGAIHEQIYGRDHPQIGHDLAHLAIVLYETSRVEDALPPIRRSLAIGEADLGPEHPIVTERYNILATILETLRRPAEADPFIRHALVAAERMLGPDHPDTHFYRANYERIVAAVDAMAQRDEAVEAGLMPAPPERLARADLPPPGQRRRGLLGRFRRARG